MVGDKKKRKKLSYHNFGMDGDMSDGWGLAVDAHPAEPLFRLVLNLEAGMSLVRFPTRRLHGPVGNKYI